MSWYVAEINETMREIISNHTYPKGIYVHTVIWSICFCAPSSSSSSSYIEHPYDSWCTQVLCSHSSHSSTVLMFGSFSIRLPRVSVSLFFARQLLRFCWSSIICLSHLTLRIDRMTCFSWWCWPEMHWSCELWWAPYPILAEIVAYLWCISGMNS